MSGQKPMPEPIETTAVFWAGLRHHQVLLQYSPSSDAYVFYPRVLAPGTLADDLEWREVSGQGTLYTFTLARRAVAPAWDDEILHIPAVVQFDQGPRISTELVNVEPAAVRIGMRVKPFFFIDPNGRGATLLMFEPA
jgi:uncharacterized OB-fold protein